jgi:hypothetical protein
MNCLQTRQAFALFWRNSLVSEERDALLAHLEQCSGCEHSFRVFALTAPALYDQRDQGGLSRSPRATELPGPSGSSGDGSRVGSDPAVRSETGRWLAFGAVFTLAAAATVILYFSAPSRVTLEDAIGAVNPGVEAASYNSDGLFGQNDLYRGSSQPGRDIAQPGINQLDSSGRGRDNGLAG